MYTLYIVSYAVLAVLSFVFGYDRYKRNKKVKDKSFDTIEQIDAKQLEPEEYAATITDVVISYQMPEGMKADLNRLKQIEGLTINGYYVVRTVYQADDYQYLVIANIFAIRHKYSTENRTNSPLQKFNGNPGYDMLYNGHILVKHDHNELSCYSFPAENEAHTQHLEEFARYLISFAVNRPYTFRLPPREQL